ncbi:hypothetical protein F4556_000756 [Kitasatospora gansuensis]|uniref:Uncharacterized protein n=1 Tax=Kitasatospora gansuensis TaxID=258050 RepID=A0A7W7S981_9ACTN|nr:hypothetical protein [Kitasatospora gansuensis]MBB4945221.1 hypothetical protein [Kitasatospora gansuensis]
MSTVLGTESDRLQGLIATLEADAERLETRGKELTVQAAALAVLPGAPPSCTAALDQQAGNCAAAAASLRVAAAALARHAAAVAVVAG